MIKRSAFTLALLLCVASGSGDATRGGTIVGAVVVVENGKPVPRDDVWVYLEDLRLPRVHAAAGSGRYEIRQENCQFTPHVLVVAVGTTVAFPNYDHQEHNVFSPTDPEFDLDRYNTDHKGKSHEFDDAAEMEIYCDIHKQMWARVKVVDSSFIQPVKAGRFEIRDVPAGAYKLHAWTYDSDESVDKVIVTDGGTVTVHDQHLQLHARAAHLRKDQTSYPSSQYTGCQ
jgi:plastocyanin